MLISAFPRRFAASMTILLCACALSPNAPSSLDIAGLPTVDFVYPVPAGPVFDRVCPTWMNRPQVTDAQREEVIRRLPEFRAAWSDVGLCYVKMVVAATGKPYPYRDMQATLSVCAPDSMAMPLIISLEELMSTNTKPYAHDFALLTFHELMHHFAMPIEQTSPLIAKYKSEPGDIRSHLHVVALERYVLEKSGKLEQLAKLKEYYRNLPRNSYARAWEIIDIETPQAFVDDLRDTPRPPK